MSLYRRPKFLEILHEIREEMSREVDYDVDLFAEMVRTGTKQKEDRGENKSYNETESLDSGTLPESKISQLRTDI